jgi:glycopeptide antibiotics resistance protein
MRQDRLHAARIADPTIGRLAYIAVLALATLVPFGFDPELSQIVLRLQRALQPSISARDAVDAARNIVLFAGWGALWAATSRSRRTLTVVVAAATTGAGLSILIESLQLLSLRRNASVLDVLTNTSGALAGGTAILTFTAALRAARGRRSFVGIPVFTFASAYLAVALLEAVFPLLRQTVLPGAQGGPLARLAVSLEHFELGSILAIPWFDIALVAPAGAFAVAALVETNRGYATAACLTVLGGGLFMTLAELAHGPLGQTIQLGAIVAHVAGLAVGVWAAVRFLPGLSRRLRGPDRPLALLVLYAALVLLWIWRPFLPEVDLQSITAQLSLSRLVPLRSLGERMDLYSVADVAELFLLFLPLGSLLAVWPLERRGAWSLFLPALYLAIAIELGQIFLAERYFDVTDILVAGSGAVIGWLVTRRAGFAPYGEIRQAWKIPRESAP